MPNAEASGRANGLPPPKLQRRIDARVSTRVVGIADQSRSEERNGDTMTITAINEMSDADRLAFFDGLCATVHSSTIAKKTDAISGEPGNFPPVAFTDIFAYGFQRRFNDGNGGADISTDDKIANGNARFINHLNGVVSARGGGISSLESEVFRMANIAFKVTEGKDAHKALGEKIPAEFRIVLTAYIGDDMADYETRAQDSLDRKAVEAATRAAEMASLLDKRDAVDFDLAKFGLTR